MTQRTRAVFQATDIPTINTGGGNTAAEIRDLMSNMSDSAMFAGEMRPAIAAARWLVPMAFGGLGNATMTLNRIYLTPIFVPHAGNYTDFGLSTVAVTAASYKVGIYADNNGIPTGTPLSGSTGTIGPVTTASATQQTLTFGAAFNFAAPGQYWLAGLTDVSGTVTNVPNTAQTNLFGAPSVDSGNGAQLYVAGTYAAGLVDLTGATLVYANGTGSFNFGLKKQ